MIRIFPSVEMRSVTSPWKTSSGVSLKLIFAEPVMIIGALKAAADQRGVRLPAEGRAFKAHAERLDVDDRELAGEKLVRVDHDPVDRAGELEPAEALDPGHARRQGQLEVRRVGRDVGPRDADRVDPDRDLARPLEAVARGAADRQEDAEPRMRDEAAVRGEAEVARLAADREAADRDLRRGRRERDDLLVAGRA